MDETQAANIIKRSMRYHRDRHFKSFIMNKNRSSESLVAHRVIYVDNTIKNKKNEVDFIYVMSRYNYFTKNHIFGNLKRFTMMISDMIYKGYVPKRIFRIIYSHMTLDEKRLWQSWQTGVPNLVDPVPRKYIAFRYSHKSFEKKYGPVLNSKKAMYRQLKAYLIVAKMFSHKGIPKDLIKTTIGFLQ